MESMRSLLKHSLGRSLATLPELDRLHAAWPVACGKQMAAHGHITTFSEGTVTVLVHDPAWLDQMLLMRGALQNDLARIAQVKLTAIHFESTAPKAGSRTERKTALRTGPRTGSRKGPTR